MPRWLKTRQIKGNVQQHEGIVHQLLSLTDYRFGTTYFIWSYCKGQYLCLKQMRSLMGLPLKRRVNHNEGTTLCVCVCVCVCVWEREREHAWVRVLSSNVRIHTPHANTTKLKYTIPFFPYRNKTFPRDGNCFFACTMILVLSGSSQKSKKITRLRVET